MSEFRLIVLDERRSRGVEGVQAVANRLDVVVDAATATRHMSLLLPLLSLPRFASF